MATLALNCGPFTRPVTHIALKHRAGSSSFKFKLFAPSLDVISSGSASAIGTDSASLRIDANKSSIKGESHHEVFREVGRPDWTVGL
jgi:acetate kinase